MKKVTIITLFFISMFIQVHSSDQNEFQPPEMRWSFIQLNNILLSEFPEAYEDFVNISFERVNESIYPVEATFLIRAKYFEKKLNDKVLKQRGGNVLHKMGDPASCWEISVGETEEYAWSEWEDKTVRKVTLKFYIGC